MHPCMWCFLSEPSYTTANDSKYSFCSRHREMTAKQPSCCLRIGTGRLLLCPTKVLHELQESSAIERRIYGTKQLPGRFIAVPRFHFKLMALRCQETPSSARMPPPPPSSASRKRRLSEGRAGDGDASTTTPPPPPAFEVLCFRNRLQRSQLLELVLENSQQPSSVCTYDQLGTSALYVVCKPRVRHRDFNHLVCTAAPDDDGASYDLLAASNADLDVLPGSAPPARHTAAASSSALGGQQQAKQPPFSLAAYVDGVRGAGAQHAPPPPARPLSSSSSSAIAPMYAALWPTGAAAAAAPPIPIARPVAMYPGAPVGPTPLAAAPVAAVTWLPMPTPPAATLSGAAYLRPIHDVLRDIRRHDTDAAEQATLPPIRLRPSN